MATTWTEALGDRIPAALDDEIDAFETQMEHRRAGTLDDKLFIEARLRRGAYGQRYDNGQRDDGARTRTLDFPCGDVTKGPHTVWDAPGMMRIKIPMGRLSATQLDVLAELAEDTSDEILHVTTRQDIQLHFIHIEDTPDLMRRLAAVGITTREACGNAVRNVTACPYAGICGGESFDVTPYAHAMMEYMLGHPDTLDFGRKFKIAFSGCAGESCGLVKFHDLGAIAVTRDVDGEPQRGFEVYVGGGLGAVPFEAKLLDPFVPADELLPLSQAICRVFARLGEKKSRARARIKFLVQKLGLEEFARLVREERAQLREDERWTAYLDHLDVTDEAPLRAPGSLPTGAGDGFHRWAETNLRPQRQEGYHAATIALPLGDFTPEQARGLADLCRQHTGDTLRLTVDQNVVVRWLSGADAPAFHAGLEALGLAERGAHTITDATACPGTDTCKLGIAASRGLVSELRRRLTVVQDELDPAVRELRLKASGCFNSCGQHHVADLGFYGVSRNVGGRKVPHFQLVLGGRWLDNGGAFGLAIGAVPSRNVPEAVERITARFAAERDADESFQSFVRRIGKSEVKKTLADLLKAPSYEQDPRYYSDWGDPREYSIGDMGIGECAGEVVPFVEFGLEEAEREVFDAQIELDRGEAARAAERALGSMLTAAKALVRHLGHQVSDEADDVVDGFRRHLHDTRVFHDPFAGGKFASYLFRIHGSNGAAGRDLEAAHQAVEEAQLFIEAAHSCYARLSARPAAGQ